MGVGVRGDVVSFQKRCRCCGRTYDAAGWASLKLVGHQDDGIELLQMRDCACLSTLGVFVAASPSECGMLPEDVGEPDTEAA